MTPRFLCFAAALLCACSSDPSAPADVPDASTPKDTGGVVDSGGSDGSVAETAKCASDETACGDTCVKLISDAKNCGKCGVACGADETCAGGACQCAAGKTKCGAACADTSSDTANCGACGKACASGETCSAGTCYPPCPTGQTRCGASCVDTSKDTKNCGACGTACATGEACNTGVCGISCDFPTKACSGKCVNVAFDVDNCGDCGKKCDSGPNGAAGCTSSSCVFTCTAPYGNCNDKASDGCEVNLSNDDKNCGVCGKSCLSTEYCLSSKCECKSGNLRCGGVCVDVTSDAANCGMCGKACASGESCSGSACQCKTGFTRCPATTGTCVDTKSDAKNCGACGTVCPGTSVCSEGLCCPAGQINCGGACVDPNADPSNCGGCGKACDSSAPYCAAAKCSATCGTLTACGLACTDLAKDSKNCGTCGKSCLTGEQCLSSACVQLGFPGSTIIDSTQGTKINTWLGTPTQMWKLCYSKGAGTASPATFHTGCDGKGASVTIAKLNSSGTIKIVGGYNTASWSGTSTYGGSSTGFLFSLTNDFVHGTPGTSSGVYYSYNRSDYGPTFGGGHDFHINSTMNGGYCNLGFTYKCRTGTYSSATCQNDFCGSYSGFTVDALEVWVK